MMLENSLDAVTQRPGDVCRALYEASERKRRSFQMLLKHD